MKKIIRFSINDRIYTIYDCKKIGGKSSYTGEVIYEQAIVFIEEGSKEQMLTTLKHELAHVWLHENGHDEQDGGCFSYEELCEYIALSADSVSRIEEEYKNAKGW